MPVATQTASFVEDRALDPSLVLLVDDDVSLLEASADLLELDGYTVATATDGRAALDQLRRGLRPCVIVLDLMMPVMNGWDFRREQLQDADLKDIPVIVVTAAGLSEATIRTQLGDVAFVPKPSPDGALVTAIRRCCGEVID